MKQSNLREKQRQLSHNKRVNYLIGGLIGLIFVLSLFTNGTNVSNSNDIQALAPTAIGISAPDSNWASPNGRWDFSWNSSWTTAAKIQNMSAALDLAYTFLITDWDLPNPLTPTSYEPPIEVSIPEIAGYNGKASSSATDSRFNLIYYPKFINHDVLSRQPLQVGEHELLHLCQYRAPGDTPAKWVLEGQARMSEDKLNDWLDHADVTDGVSGTYLAECNGYLTGSHVNDLTSITYPACMFWNYVCEQFGTDKIDPDYGFDIIRDFWSSAVNPSGTDGITMFNNLMTFRGT
ncbi:MAG: hypothetical protein LUQ65_05770, partial [Candidatus Helarchaeota archaeon]|nr:hypothetical protein [Candidatus Helarchaeota archaeon]